MNIQEDKNEQPILDLQRLVKEVTDKVTVFLDVFNRINFIDKFVLNKPLIIRKNELQFDNGGHIGHLAMGSTGILSYQYDSGAKYDLSRPIVSKLITRDTTVASGAVTTAHGLGRIPSFVEAQAFYVGGSAMSLSSYGTYDGTNQKCIYFSKNGATPQANNDTAFAVGLVAVGGSDYQTAVITFDATNVTLTWTKTGSPTGTASIILKIS